MRKSLALSIATASIAGVGALVPAAANAACDTAVVGDVCSGGTTVTATVGTVGVIAIAVQPTAALVGTTSPATGSLGLTTITDTQTGSHSYTVSIKSTDFTLAGASTTISAAKASVSMPASGATAPTVAIPGTATISSNPAASSPLTLSNTNQTLLGVNAANANTVTYTPSMSLDFSGAPTGVYTGTVTQTVS